MIDRKELHVGLNMVQNWRDSLDPGAWLRAGGALISSRDCNPIAAIEIGC